MANILIDVSSNHSLLNSNEKDANLILTTEELSDFHILSWFGTDEKHPVQSDSLLEANFSPPLPIIPYLPYIDSQKDVFIQNVSEKIEELQLILDSKDSEQSAVIGSHFLQIIHVMHQWVEHLEVWILNISELSSKECSVEYKKIEDELSVVEQQVLSIQDVTLKLADVIPVPAQQQTLKSLEDLKHRIDTTKNFASTCFSQMLKWHKEGKNLDEQHKLVKAKIDSLSISLKNRVDDSTVYHMPLTELYEIRKEMLEYSSSSELFCLEKQKLCLIWPGYNYENTEDCLKQNRDLKSVVSTTCLEVAQDYDYRSAYKKACDYLKVIFVAVRSFCELPSPVFIDCLDELTGKLDYLKEMEHALICLSHIVKNKYSLSNKNFRDENKKEFDVVLSEVLNSVSIIENKFMQWNECLLLLKDLLVTLDRSRKWIEDKTNTLKVQPCPTEDLQQYSSFIKSLRHDLQNFFPHLYNMQQVMKRVKVHVNCQQVHNSFAEFTKLFSKLQENVNVKMNIASPFTNEYLLIHKELKDLQSWYTDASSRLQYVQQEVNSSNGVATLFENLQRIAVLESELECNEPARVQNMVDDENLLNLFCCNKSNLDDVLSERNQMKSSFEETKKVISKYLLSFEEIQIKEHIGLWLEDIQLSYNALNINNIDSEESLKDFRRYTYKCFKEMSIISKFLSDSKMNMEGIAGSQFDVYFNERKSDNLNEDSINILKLKMQIEVNKIEDLMNQFDKYKMISSAFLLKLESIFSSLEKMSSLIQQSNYSDVISMKEEIQTYHNFMKENHMLETVKQIGEEMLKSTICDFVKTFIDSTENRILEKLSQIDILIKNAEKSLIDCSKQWENFENALKDCYKFISEQNWLLSVNNNLFINKEHVSYSLTMIEDLIENLNLKNDLLKNVLRSSDALEGDRTEIIKAEIINRKDLLIQTWNKLSDDLSSNFKLLSTLKVLWAEFDNEISALDSWILETQSEVISLQTNRPCMFLELENLCKEMEAKTEKWQLIQKAGDELTQSFELQISNSTQIKRKILFTNSQMKSLEKNLNYLKEYMLPTFQEYQTSEKAIEDAENFFDNIQQKCSEKNCENDKEELEDELYFNEVLLENIVSSQASLQHIKRTTIFCQSMDYAFVNKVSKLICLSEKVIRTVTSRYFKLMQTYCEKCSLIEKISIILKNFQKYKNLQDELQNLENQATYLRSLELYMKCRLFDIFVHSHRNLLRCVVKEYQTKVNFASISEKKFLEYAQQLNESWNRFEHFHEINSSRAKEKIKLWENYLHHSHQSRIHLQDISRYISRFPRIVPLQDLGYEIYKAEKWMNFVQSIEKSISDAATAAKELTRVLNFTPEKHINKSILQLENSLEKQGISLHALLSGLRNAQIDCERIEELLKSHAESLNSHVEFLEKAIPNFHLELQAVFNRDKPSAEILDDTACIMNEKSNEVSLSAYAEDLFMQVEILSVVHDYFDNFSTSASIDKSKTFTNYVRFLTEWFSQTTEKINSKYFGTLEDIQEELNSVIYRDIQDKLELYDLVKYLGQQSIMYHNDEKLYNYEENLELLDRWWIHVNEIFGHRMQNIRSLSVKKREISTELADLRELLLQIETNLKGPLELNEVSEKEINSKISTTEELLPHMDELSDKISFLSNDLSILIDQPDAFSCSLEKNTYLQSFQNVQQRYELLKTWSLKRYKYLKHVLSDLNNILNLLKRLEEWLSDKEAISSEINFADQNHNRSIYLKGIKTFDNLNHDIQDNVYLLHNVNAAFHAISRKELDVDDALKVRVIAVNNRWHKFYENVSNILENVKQVLQMWDTYDKLKEHLLLLLTEIDMKLTTLEQSNYFSQDEFTSMMKEMYQHEEELLKFNSLASNLKVICECSERVIESDVQNIQTYWDEILKRLSKFKENIKSEYVVAECEVTSQKVEEFKEVSLKEIIETTSKEALTIPEVRDEVDDSVQREYIKDLLAALDEAEERIDSLEVVLSEPTPTEVDEDTGPNYSRLLAACRSSIDVIQHLNNILSENPSLGSSECIRIRTEGMINRWEKIENATLDKELRAMKRFEKWQQFCLELKNIEKWLLDSLQLLTSQTMSDVNVEKFIMMLQKHKALISEIGGYKKSILTLNAAGQNLNTIFKFKDDPDSIKEKLKAVNEHWNKLCLVALEWQNKLQSEFLESEDLKKTLLEMELWLKESRERLLTVPLKYEKGDKRIYDLHTEVFALKQQLENCSQQVQLLLNVSDQLFDDETMDEEKQSASRYTEIQSKLSCILKESEDLQSECSERLLILSKLLLTNRISPLPEEEQANDSSEENRPTKIRQCCQYLVRVARASIPLQAILLLLLGAAFLIPRDEEEISCRLSNNFASSLNSMLRYPDGPPPV